MSRKNNGAPREVEVAIAGLSDEGLGEGMVNDRPILVRNALPGETVTARILRKRKGFRFADGITPDLADTHEHRIAPACGNFPRCGGCAMHHLDHTAQLAHKQGQLAQALTGHGVAVHDWSPPVSVVRLGYRRKARLGVRLVGDQVLVGFRESFSNRVARLLECPVLTPQLSRLLGPLRNLLRRMSNPDQIPQIEVAQGDGQPVLMVRHLTPFDADDLQMWKDFQSAAGVCILLQPGGYETLRTLDGGAPPMLGYRLPDSGLHMQFLPHQFTQVNLQMNQALIRYAIAYLGGMHSERLRNAKVADLFCGIGNISLPLARAGARVWGYEVAQQAVDMAWHNARRNGIDGRTHFAALDLYGEGAALPEDFDILVLDPPRSGAGPNLQGWLRTFSGDVVIYISCNPVSFAQDAAVFDQAGFALSRVGIFDMFPHTAHVETMGVFRRSDSLRG